MARAVWRGIWQLIAAVLLTVAGLWSLRQASALVRYLILAQLLAFALEPAVTWLHQRDGAEAARPVCCLAGSWCCSCCWVRCWRRRWPMG